MEFGQEISASYNTLYTQAMGAGEDYFNSALRVIQTAKGKKDGEKPTDKEIECAVALASITAADFNSASLGVAAQKIAHALEDIARGLLRD
jgi:hypothetical protein